MGILLFYFTWVMAPFAEFVIIIALCIINHQNKKRIWELESLVQSNSASSADQTAGKKKKAAGYGEWKPLASESENTSSVSSISYAAVPARSPKSPSRAGIKAKETLKQQGTLGTISLIIGVIFIVLSGLIFATTTWDTLSDFGKVLLVFIGAVLFFGASCMAEKVLHIHKTSNAFYLLGSIFLFLTVLAAAYFKLLGPEFILKGRNRWRVLWVGSLVLECAFIAGLKQFHDRIFTQTVLWGVTVNLFFLANALGLDGHDLINMMMIYALVLVLGREFFEKKAGEKQTLRVFASIHFFVLSALSMLQGWMEMIWTAMDFHPVVSLLGMISLAAVSAGMGFYAWKEKTKKKQLLFAGAGTELISYMVLLVPIDRVYQLCLASALFFLWFLAGRKRKGFWESQEINGILFVCVFLYTGFAFILAVLEAEGILELIAVSGAIFLLAAMADQWGEKNKYMRMTVPFILWFLTITAYLVWERVSETEIDFFQYEILFFVFFIGIMLWNIRKKDEFLPFIWIAGTLAQIFSFCWDEKGLPFFMLLGLYLLLAETSKTGKKKEFFSRAGIVYVLAGTYFPLCYLTDKEVVRLSAGNLGFLIFQLIRLQKRKKKEDVYSLHTLFWDICGCVMFLFTIMGYYCDEKGGIGSLLFCLAAFAGYYLWFYRGNRQWPHLLLAVSILGLPFTFVSRFNLTSNQHYLLVMLAFLGTAIPARLHSPIIKQEEEVQGGWRVDWHQVLTIWVLLAMTAHGNSKWQFVYLILISLYFLPYLVIPELKKGAALLSACFLSAAFWEQPFIQWPSLIALELQLLPLAMLIGILGLLWKGEKIKWIQTAGYLICLVILGIDAVMGGLVGDALILEGICFFLLIGAQLKKSVRWIRISSIIMLLIVIFMTKEFWLSISWWIYLLAAGVSLIIFAAVNERKKR